MSLRWGVVCTLKAAPQEVLAFAAYHLDMGAHRVWLHFDDPDDPMAALLDGQKGLRVIRCDTGYWQRLCGGRPEKHQERQTRNATRLFRRAPVDWLLHIDVDEFLLPEVDIAQTLDAVPAGQDILRIEPFEALHDPALPDDIFTATRFRGALRDEASLRRIYGPVGPLLRHGMLSHSVGKAFFRCAAEGMVVHIHGARRQGVRVPGGAFQPGLSLLHFHAEDPARWLDRLDYRIERGGYQFVPELQAHLRELDAKGRAAFYDRVQRARPEVLEGLAAEGALRSAALGLRDRIAARGWSGLIPPPR